MTSGGHQSDFNDEKDFDVCEFTSLNWPGNMSTNVSLWSEHRTETLQTQSVSQVRSALSVQLQTLVSMRFTANEMHECDVIKL